MLRRDPMGREPPNFKNKCKFILYIEILDILIVPILFAILGLMIGVDSVIYELKSYAEIRPDYFLPTNDFFVFLGSSALKPAFVEEIQFRLLPYVLMAMLIFLFTKYGIYKNGGSKLLQKIAYVIIWIPFLIGTYYWILIHSYHFSPILIPVFFAGLTWSWLIIRTGSWWPALVAHILANTTIYFFVKILFLLGYKF